MVFSLLNRNSKLRKRLPQCQQRLYRLQLPKDLLLQQFQEEQVKEYKAQDEEFLKWAKEQVKAGRQIGYDCSW